MTTQTIDYLSELDSNIKVDYKKIAEGIFSMMLENNPDDLACMVYGMLPHKWVKLTEKQMTAKFERIVMPVRDLFKEVWTKTINDPKINTDEQKRCDEFVIEHTRKAMSEVNRHLLHLACEKGICKV